MTLNLGRLEISTDRFYCMTQVQNYTDNKTREDTIETKSGFP